jgi:hypothetical protein
MPTWHNHTMPDWKPYSTTEIDGVALVVKERTDLRNAQGALEYLVEARIGGEVVTTERHTQSVWLGHCFGQLLLPLIAKRARQLVAGPSSNTTGTGERR